MLRRFALIAILLASPSAFAASFGAAAAPVSAHGAMASTSHGMMIRNNHFFAARCIPKSFLTWNARFYKAEEQGEVTF